MALRNFIRRRPLLSYFTLAYAISWTGVLFVTINWGQGPAAGDASKPFGLVLLFNLLGPAAAALATSYAVGEGREFRRLFANLFILLAFTFVSPAFAPGLMASPPLSSLALGVAGGLAIGFVEEIGWTGFALRKLMASRGAEASALHGLGACRRAGGERGPGSAPGLRSISWPCGSSASSGFAC